MPDPTLEIRREAKAETLAHIRDYLGRGRPLGGLPMQSLRAQWFDACLAFCVRGRDGRWQEFCDLELEFGLRGVDSPMYDDKVDADVAPLLKRREALQHLATPDTEAQRRLDEDAKALCDCLIARDREALAA